MSNKREDRFVEDDPEMFTVRKPDGTKVDPQLPKPAEQPKPDDQPQEPNDQ